MVFPRPHDGMCVLGKRHLKARSCERKYKRLARVPVTMPLARTAPFNIARMTSYRYDKRFITGEAVDNRGVGIQMLGHECMRRVGQPIG